MNTYLKQLKADAAFREAMKEVLAMRPIVPDYSPGIDLEEIKFKTGERKGFDLIYLYLTGDKA